MAEALKRPGGELASRPLHFFWVVDCSGSMYGEKIGTVNHAIQSTIPEMVDAAKDNPNAQLLVRTLKCALPGFVDSKNEEKTERNAGYLVVSHSGGGMLRQGTRKGIRRTPANRGMRAHWVVKGLDISEDVCHGMCP